MQEYKVKLAACNQLLSHIGNTFLDAETLINEVTSGKTSTIVIISSTLLFSLFKSIPYTLLLYEIVEIFDVAFISPLLYFLSMIVGQLLINWLLWALVSFGFARALGGNGCILSHLKLFSCVLIIESIPALATPLFYVDIILGLYMLLLFELISLIWATWFAVEATSKLHEISKLKAFASAILIPVILVIGSVFLLWLGIDTIMKVVKPQ